MPLPINVLNLVSIKKKGSSIILVYTINGDTITNVLTEVESCVAEGDTITIKSHSTFRIFHFSDVPAQDRAGAVTASQFAKYLSILLLDDSSVEVGAEIFLPLADGVTVNAAVDGSVTPVDFDVVAGTNILIVKLVKTFLEGTAIFTAEKFGDLPELANGIQFLVNGVVVTTMKNNRDFVLQALADGHPFLASEAKHLVSMQAWSPGIVVNRGDKLTMRVRDNLTGLTYLGAHLAALAINE